MSSRRRNKNLEQNSKHSFQLHIYYYNYTYILLQCISVHIRINSDRYSLTDSHHPLLVMWYQPSPFNERAGIFMIHHHTKFPTPRICAKFHFHHIQTQTLTKFSQRPRLVISQYGNKYCPRPTNSRIPISFYQVYYIKN